MLFLESPKIFCPIVGAIAIRIGGLCACDNMTSYHTVSISAVTSGSVLALPAFDDRRLKLLDKGTVLNQQLIDRLKAAGITEVDIEYTAEIVASHDPHFLPSGRNLIEHCSLCGALIGLQPPAPTIEAAAWCCTACGAFYFGVDDGCIEQGGLYRVDQAVKNPFAPASGPSIAPEHVRRLISSLATEEYKGPNLRAHKRYFITVPVVALPLAADFRIDGEPLQMTTANMSLGGAALIYTRFVDAQYMALDFTAAGLASLQVVLKVLRLRNLGPVYEFSGAFISRLSLASDLSDFEA
jgi:hypothetical protein